MGNQLVYTSDSHLLHRNIVAYAWRPYNTCEQMDVDLITKLREAHYAGKTVIHGGDVSFNLRKVIRQYGPLFGDGGKHKVVIGNHDRARGNHLVDYVEQFVEVVGNEKTFRENSLILDDTLQGEHVKILVSHVPQVDLQGCDFNVHGHIHNNILLRQIIGDDHHPEENFTFESPQHLNSCVELHGFRPVSLEDLVVAHRSKYESAKKDMRQPTAPVVRQEKKEGK